MSIKRDRATGKNLGYGFVKLSSHQEARAAKEAMQVGGGVGVWMGLPLVRCGEAADEGKIIVAGRTDSCRRNNALMNGERREAPEQQRR